MNLSKDFGCSPNGLLIDKLKAYGLTTEACEFISGYLIGRYQRVKLSNENISCKTLTKDISNELKLGLIIFNIFMNGAFYYIHKSDFVNYTDDDIL